MAINPLQQPINYSVDVQSPFAAAIEGMRFAAGQEELQAMRDKRQLEAQQRQAEQAQQVAAQAQQQRFQSNLDAFFDKPPSERKYSELEPLLVGANKQQFEALKQIGDNMNADQLAAAKKFTGQLLLSFEGNPENAKTMLRERIAVEADPNQKRAFETILGIADIDSKEAARLVEENAGATFGADFYKGIEAVREGRRKADKPTDKGFTVLSAAEVKSYGLPPGSYQKSPTGEIKSIVKEPLVSVSVGPTGQREMLALKELDIPRAKEFSDAAASGRALARDSRIISNLLKGKGGGQLVKLTTDIARNFGFESDSVTANDLANALATRGAVSIRAPGSGSTSDIEFKSFLQAFPSLSNSESGRELMAKYAEAFAKRSARLADHARRLIREDRYTEEEIASFDESLGPILDADFYRLAAPGRRPNVPVFTPGATREAPAAAPAARTVESVLQQYLPR